MEGRKYVVTGEENGIIFNLINPNEGSTSKIELNTGGQIGLFESKYILSKENSIQMCCKMFDYGMYSTKRFRFILGKILK